MIAATVFRRRAQGFLQDARVLLSGRRLDGAAYLCGYAVELGLKARICRTLKWSGYPQSKREFEPLGSFRTHDLDVLLRLAGREDFVRANYLAEWSAVASWDPESRYRAAGTVSAADVTAMIAAAELLLRKL